MLSNARTFLHTLETPNWPWQCCRPAGLRPLISIASMQMLAYIRETRDRTDEWNLLVVVQMRHIEALCTGSMSFRQLHKSEMRKIQGSSTSWMASVSDHTADRWSYIAVPTGTQLAMPCPRIDLVSDLL